MVCWMAAVSLVVPLPVAPKSRTLRVTLAFDGPAAAGVDFCATPRLRSDAATGAASKILRRAILRSVQVFSFTGDPRSPLEERFNQVLMTDRFPSLLY